MKRFVVSLLTSILAFTAGLITASSWSSNDHGEKMPVIVNAAPPCPPNQPPAQSYADTTSPSEFDFAQGRLKAVPERVRLKSESLRYDIDVKFPQIVATVFTESQNIRKVNQQVREAATQLYQWPLRANSNIHGNPQGYKIVNFSYEVTLASESQLSISFMGYSYASGTDYPTSQNFSVNYDLTSGKLLKLNDIFKPGSKYLEFISRYCIDQLSKEPSSYIKEGLSPTTTNFENWHFTSNGITFAFPACKVRNCAAGDQTIAVPFEHLKPILNPAFPGKLNITYP